MTEQIVIYESQDGIAKIDVQIQGDTVWLNRQQMAELLVATSRLLVST